MGVFAFFKGKNNKENKDISKAEIDTKIIDALQEIQPWLVRTAIDDVIFSKMMSKMDIVLIRNNDVFSIDSMDDAIAVIKKGFHVISPERRDVLDKSYLMTFIWMRYVCVKNKRLYQSITSLCFDKDTILQATQDRIKYVKGRFLNMGVSEYQANDIYYIVKGYMDTMFKVGPIFRKIIKNVIPDQDKVQSLINDANARFEDTEKIRMVMSLDEIAYLAVRDFLSQKNINIEDDIIVC